MLQENSPLPLWLTAASSSSSSLPWPRGIVSAARGDFGQTTFNSQPLFALISLDFARRRKTGRVHMCVCVCVPACAVIHVCALLVIKAMAANDKLLLLGLADSAAKKESPSHSHGGCGIRTYVHECRVTPFTCLPYSYSRHTLVLIM